MKRRELGCRRFLSWLGLLLAIASYRILRRPGSVCAGAGIAE